MNTCYARAHLAGWTVAFGKRIQILPSVTARNGTVERLNALHREYHSWRKVAALYDISAGMAFRVATQGYEPKDPEIRRKLGFPIPVTTWQGPKGRFIKRDRPG